MDFNKQLFRCSALGKLMTDPRSKSETLSETTKSYLLEVFIEAKYGRKKDISNKYMDKGLFCEEDSLSLVSNAVYKAPVFKNKATFKNEFIVGTPDLILENEVVDIKTSWDIFTFFNSDLSKDYYWQLMGYMALTGKTKARLIYCLVDSPDFLLEQEKRSLAWKMGLIDHETNKEYLQKVEQLEKNMTFKDIQESERVRIFDIEYSETEIQRLYSRIEQCREYLTNNFSN